MIFESLISEYSNIASNTDNKISYTSQSLILLAAIQYVHAICRRSQLWQQYSIFDYYNLNITINKIQAKYKLTLILQFTIQCYHLVNF